MSIGAIFSGQGAQVVGMGQSLYETSETTKSLYDRANEILGWDLKALCFDGPEAELTETKVCQPALYVHGFAVFSLLRERGVLQNLEAVCGLSLGELTAYAAAEVYDFETGLQIVAERARLMQEACESTDGSMAAVIGGTVETVTEFCKTHGLEVANLNCPGQVVISGEKERIAKAVEGAKGVFKLCKELNVAGAYHSRLMNSAKDGFEKFLRDIPFSAPKVRTYTNVTGEQIADPDAIKQALVRQVVSSVHFEDNLRNLATDVEATAVYECGPGKVLAGFAKRIDRSLKVVSVESAEDLDSL